MIFPDSSRISSLDLFLQAGKLGTVNWVVSRTVGLIYGSCNHSPSESLLPVFHQGPGARALRADWRNLPGDTGTSRLQTRDSWLVSRECSTVLELMASRYSKQITLESRSRRSGETPAAAGRTTRRALPPSLSGSALSRELQAYGPQRREQSGVCARMILAGSRCCRLARARPPGTSSSWRR